MRESLQVRVVDPRSRMIRPLARQVAHRPEHVRLLDLSSAVDEAFSEQTREQRIIQAQRALRVMLAPHRAR